MWNLYSILNISSSHILETMFINICKVFTQISDVSKTDRCENSSI